MRQARTKEGGESSGGCCCGWGDGARRRGEEVLFYCSKGAGTAVGGRVLVHIIDTIPLWK